MIEGSQNQIVASLLNLEQMFASLYELKFKGKKSLQQLANTLYERELMAKSIRSSATQTERMIYDTAIINCTKEISSQIALFQTNFVEIYSAVCPKIALNNAYLEKCIRRQSSKQAKIEGNADFLLAELSIFDVIEVQLGQKIGGDYEKQFALVNKCWEKIGKELFYDGKPSDSLKEFLLHVGFQSLVQSETVQIWKNKLSAFSNQRYNPKK